MDDDEDDAIYSSFLGRSVGYLLGKHLAFYSQGELNMLPNNSVIGEDWRIKKLRNELREGGGGDAEKVVYMVLNKLLNRVNLRRGGE